MYYEMGRYYGGDIEGKFWFGIQSSDDVSNLVSCEEIQHLIWVGCGCLLEHADLIDMKKKCNDSCGDLCCHVYCKDCYESYEEHKQIINEENGWEEGDEVYDDDNSISYAITADEHLEELKTSLHNIELQLPEELVQKYRYLENDEKIVCATHFNVITNEYLDTLFHSEDEKKKYYTLIARYQLGLQIKYVLVKDGDCNIHCEL